MGTLCTRAFGSETLRQYGFRLAQETSFPLEVLSCTGSAMRK